MSHADRIASARPTTAGGLPPAAAEPRAVAAAIVIGASLLYVYRLEWAGVNLSPFRLVAVAWLAAVAAQLASGRLDLSRRALAVLALAPLLVAVNLVDVARTREAAVIGRDAANHVLNVAIAMLVVAAVQDRATLVRWLRIFAWSSLLPLAISSATLVLGTLPFEQLLLDHRTERITVEQYTIQYESTLRLAASFYDPNFYGIYLVQVLAILWWLRPAVRRLLAVDVLAALNLGALLFTLSRTAWAGLTVLAAVVLVTLPPRQRLNFGVAAAATVFGVAVVMTVQADNPVARDLAARFSDAASTVDRFDYLANGWRAFSASPWIGSGSEALVTERTPIASAHNVYLSWLAKFGVLGTIPYVAFLFGPLLLAATGRVPDPSARRLIALLLLPLALMYMAYDAFSFLEFQYLLFGLVWAAATIGQPRRPDAGRREPAGGAVSHSGA